MSLAWDPVPGAQGYRVYYGLESGQYSQSLDVGPSTEGTLTLLDDCTTHYVAVKAYNSDGESVGFSNELAGWARPRVVAEAMPVFEQGGQYALNLSGANFEPQAELIFDATDFEGNPLILSQAVTVESCDSIEALVTVEPTARGFRAMPVGEHQLEIRNPDGVFTSSLYGVELKPERLDINQSDAPTTDRVDGKDLVWLAYAYGSGEGEDRFNPDADLTGDGFVDGEDLAWLASVFGACWNGATWSEEACP